MGTVSVIDRTQDTGGYQHTIQKQRVLTELQAGTRSTVIDAFVGLPKPKVEACAESRKWLGFYWQTCLAAYQTTCKYIESSAHSPA